MNRTTDRPVHEPTRVRVRPSRPVAGRTDGPVLARGRTTGRREAAQRTDTTALPRGSRSAERSMATDGSTSTAPGGGLGRHWEQRAIARSMAFANGTTGYGRVLPLAADVHRFDRTVGSGPFDGDLTDEAQHPDSHATRRVRKEVRPPQSLSSPSGRAHLLGDAVAEHRNRNAVAPGAGPTTRRPGDDLAAAVPTVSSAGSGQGRTLPTQLFTHGAVALAPSTRTPEGRSARPRLTTVAPAADGRSVGSWILFGIGVLGAALFAAVALHAALAQRQEGIEARNARIIAAERAHDRLRVEVAQLESPSRIAAEAGRLGLRPPVTVRFIDPNAAKGGLVVVGAPGN